LCRLRYTGSVSTWGFAIYQAAAIDTSTISAICSLVGGRGCGRFFGGGFTHDIGL